jgi:hypothetical protein
MPRPIHSAAGQDQAPIKTTAKKSSTDSQIHTAQNGWTSAQRVETFPRTPAARGLTTMSKPSRQAPHAGNPLRAHLPSPGTSSCVVDTAATWAAPTAPSHSPKTHPKSTHPKSRFFRRKKIYFLSVPKRCSPLFFRRPKKSHSPKMRVCEKTTLHREIGPRVIWRVLDPTLLGAYP